MRGSGSAGKGRLARRRRALPGRWQLLRGLGAPARSEAVTPAPGSAAKCHSQVGALPTASERDPRSALYNPRPGRARGGIGPPSARPTPPPGAPRPRPSPPPARSPRNHGGAAPLTWPWPQPPALVAPPFAAHAPCRGVSAPPPARPGCLSAAPRPSSSGRPILAAPLSPLWLSRSFWTAPPAIRRCGRQPFRPEERKDLDRAATGAPEAVTGVGREPKRCLKPVLGGDLESQLALCIVGQKSLIFPDGIHHCGGCLQSRPNVALPPGRQ